MQTLGLASESKRSDGWLKSLLWPRVENAWDVDYLGQQGMWICTLVAVSSLIMSFATANVLVIAIGVLAALFYLIGGMGVRQANWPAAAMVFALYVLGAIVQIAGGQVPNIFRIIFTFVLLSNLRAAFLASQWKPLAEGEDRPTRFSETLADKFIDQMPAKLWPILQIPFLILGIALLLFSLLFLGLAIASRLGVLPHH
jgi:hypothetical protein